MPMLFNKGKRTITYTKGIEKVIDTHGKEVDKVITETIVPEQRKEIPVEAANKLKRLYPKEIINLDNTEDLKAQFLEKPKEKSRDVAIKKENNAKEPGEGINEKENGQNSEEIIAHIDGLDRLGLLAFIEEHDLTTIEVKNYKNPDALKRAVLTAYEAKAAA